VPCFAFAGTHKKEGFLVLARRKPQRYRVAGGIARIGNTARADKTLFYVPDSVKLCTRG
jgi:hypothetical protein